MRTVTHLVKTYGNRARFTYTNWKGRVAVRTIQPIALEYVHNSEHPQGEWCIRATCLDKNEVRSFALRNIDVNTIELLD